MPTKEQMLALKKEVKDLKASKAEYDLIVKEHNQKIERQMPRIKYKYGGGKTNTLNDYAKLFEEGKKVPEVARILNVSKSTAHAMRNKWRFQIHRNTNLGIAKITNKLIKQIQQGECIVEKGGSFQEVVQSALFAEQKSITARHELMADVANYIKDYFRLAREIANQEVLPNMIRIEELNDQLFNKPHKLTQEEAKKLNDELIKEVNIKNKKEHEIQEQILRKFKAIQPDFFKFGDLN